MIYNFYIFDRHCQCVFYLEFQTRSYQTATGGLKPALGIEYFAWPPYPDSESVAGVSSKPIMATYVPATFSELGLIERSKLVYGVVFSLKTFASKLAGPLEDGFLAFRTHSYKLHYYETLTGLRLIVTTDPQCPHLKSHLKTLFASSYVEQVVKNPAASIACTNADQQTTGHHAHFNNPMFTASVVKFLSHLPHFSS